MELPHLRRRQIRRKIQVITTVQLMKNAKVLRMLSKSGYLCAKRRFSVRKSSFKKSKEGVQKYRYFVCSKQGFKRTQTNGKGLSELPSYYILNRWTKMASSKPIFNVNSTLLEGCSQMMHKDKLISNNWVEFLECIDPDKLTLVGKIIQNVVKELKEFDGGTSESKISEFESFIGSSVPERIDILPPKQCHTKGSGKCLKGGKEKSMEQQQKRQRLCKACGQQSYHDSRNYPSKLSS
ncbi:hypothetical protein Cgig2_033138 [Carnegiea gigantea]|uniref:Uncharacterized protein n=1 Tax=Carnegiea gigantea TaxID=171969 RepID=A0A9Q1JN39_9CARY|nr:hypothetical protein Cgig2_033138 [Carnegiea gigantea]